MDLQLELLVRGFDILQSACKEIDMGKEAVVEDWSFALSEAWSVVRESSCLW